MEKLNRRRSWLVSGAASALILVGLFHVTDLETLRQAAGSLSLGAFAAGLLLLQLEGVCTACRLSVLAGPQARVISSFEVAAWWVAGLVVLPARLGEISGMHAYCSRFNQPAGAAVNSLLVQRLLDLAVLFVFGAVLMASHSDFSNDARLTGLTVLLGVVLLCLCIRVAVAFSAVARFLSRWRHLSVGRWLLKTALGGRAAARELTQRRALTALLSLTLVKWCFNLMAIAILVRALFPQLSWDAVSAVAVLFNLAAVIPLQTIGGIGIGEAAFVTGFGLLDIDLPSGVAAALVLRAALFTAPLVFWLVVMSCVALLRVRAAPGRRNLEG